MPLSCYLNLVVSNQRNRPLALLESDPERCPHADPRNKTGINNNYPMRVVR